ncbi:hypothetical protein [Litorivivens sp.]|uniref:hypothetical protein n=1 Tax=Litorivivens sp. TaxID=2020868 RepID=UPI0035681D76
MKGTVVLQLCMVVCLGLLFTGCGKMESTGGDGHGDTAVTDVTSITELGAPSSGTVAPADEGGGDGQTSGESISADAANAGKALAQPLDLNLVLPAESEQQYLFSEKSQAPNFFQSQEPKPAVKWKGKLYMIEEPATEKRMENVDGGEISVVVPLK